MTCSATDERQCKAAAALCSSRSSSCSGTADGAGRSSRAEPASERGGGGKATRGVTRGRAGAWACDGSELLRAVAGVGARRNRAHAPWFYEPVAQASSTQGHKHGGMLDMLWNERHRWGRAHRRRQGLGNSSSLTEARDQARGRGERCRGSQVACRCAKGGLGKARWCRNHRQSALEPRKKMTRRGGDVVILDSDLWLRTT